MAETDKYGQGFLTFEAISAASLEMAANAHRRGGGLSGIATEFADLDRKLGGLQPSDLIVLAGRTSMGKTALATNIAFNVARARHRSLTERKELPATDPGRDAFDEQVQAPLALELAHAGGELAIERPPVLSM